MVKLKKYFKITTILLVLFSCSSIADNFSADLQKKYDKGIALFNKKKYTRAREQFEFIIMNNPGSKLSIDAQFYLAESMYYNKNYIDANSAYSQYIRWSTDRYRVEDARYKIANCAVNSVNKYQMDQGEAIAALSLLQEFIDDYPSSDFINDSELLVSDIRDKLARKEYEAGRLYLKLEKYEAAIIYFSEVINEFYDTHYFEKAHIGIMLSYSLNSQDSLLSKYFHENINIIELEKNIITANQIKENKISSIELFKQLYR